MEPSTDVGQTLVNYAFLVERFLLRGCMDLEAELRRLQQENAALQAALVHTQAERDEERAKREAAEQVVLRLQRDLEKLKRQLIGPKSERIVDPNQLPLPVGPAAEPAEPATASEEQKDEEEQPAQTEKKRRRRKGSDRRDVSKMDHLIVEEHVVEVADRRCPCGCGAEAHTVGHEVAWRLDYKPAQLIRIKTVREKVVFPDHVGPGEATLVTAEPPIAFALPKALCGNRLLAQIAVDKYADHLPVYRQEARFKREGIHLPRSTQCTWMMDLSELLQPVWKHISREVLAGDWLRADATGMPVIDKARSRGKAHRGHLWAWGNYETVLFNYTPDKTAPTVAALFPGFEGTVLIDGATDFNLLEASNGVVRAGCWAHARRYFYEAMKEDKTLALKGLGIIRELFMAERVVMAADVDERKALREELSAPVLEGIQRWVREELPRQGSPQRAPRRPAVRPQPVEPPPRLPHHAPDRLPQQRHRARPAPPGEGPRQLAVRRVTAWREGGRHLLLADRHVPATGPSSRRGAERRACRKRPTSPPWQLLQRRGGARRA